MIIITIMSIYLVVLYAIYLIDGISADIEQCHEDRIDAWYIESIATPSYSGTYTYTLKTRSLDERLCEWLAPRYGRAIEIVETAMLIWRSRKDDSMRLQTIVEARVRESLEKKLESMVVDSVTRAVQSVDLDTLIERVLGDEPTMEESAVHELATPKTVTVSNGETLDNQTLDISRFEVDEKGYLTSLLAESGEVFDCTSHRFRATPHFNSGKLCTMIQGTTTKTGFIVGQYTTDKYLCLTSKGGVVVRRMSAVTLESAPTQKREVKVATAGDYTVAAPDYRGNHPIAFMADGSLLTRADGTVVTVKVTTPKGKLWLSNPAMIPSSIRGSANIVPVVYTN